MKHKLNRLTALLLAVVMTFSVLLVPVEAASFADVSGKAWYKSAVDFVSEKGFMAGVSEAQFAPNANMTRAMFVTVLASFSDVETKCEKTLFSDVPANKWYTGAVTWAAQNGLVSGVGDGRFAPNASITRQDLCTVLAKFLSMEDMTLTRSKDTSFQDEEQISSYAKEAVRFCAQTGLVSGFDDGSFRPKETATRAQVAAILQKLYGLTGGVPLRPAQMLHSKADASMAVTVDAPRGALPEDTDLTVTRVTDEATLAELAKKANGKLIAAADITFSKSGAELEPKTEVEVQIALDGLEDVKNPTVCHVRADGTLEYVSSEQVSLNRSAGSKALRFCAKDFSVYAVFDDVQIDSRVVKIHFMTKSTGNGDYDTDRQQVVRVSKIQSTPADTLLVYDPGVQRVEANKTFMGWRPGNAAGPDTTQELVSVEEINAAVRSCTGSADLYYYAETCYVAQIIYHDQAGAVNYVQTAPLADDQSAASMTVDHPYTPMMSDQSFTGIWLRYDPEGTDIVPSKTYPEYREGSLAAANRISNKTSVSVSKGSPLHLFPYVQKGFWISFDNNETVNNDVDHLNFPEDDTPGKYMMPLFFEAGATVREADLKIYEDGELFRPYRPGYVFEAWYKDSALTQPLFENGATEFTITKDMKLYAKWSFGTSSYTVSYWKEYASDNDFLDENYVPTQRNYYYVNSEVVTARTGARVFLDSGDPGYDPAKTGDAMEPHIMANADAAYGVVRAGTDDYMFSYDVDESTARGGVRVYGDGRGVMDAKFDRKLMTLRFLNRTYTQAKVPQSNSETYSYASDPYNGTQYTRISSMTSLNLNDFFVFERKNGTKYIRYHAYPVVKAGGYAYLQADGTIPSRYVQFIIPNWSAVTGDNYYATVDYNYGGTSYYLAKLNRPAPDDSTKWYEIKGLYGAEAHIGAANVFSGQTSRWWYWGFNGRYTFYYAATQTSYTGRFEFPLMTTYDRTMFYYWDQPYQVGVTAGIYQYVQSADGSKFEIKSVMPIKAEEYADFETKSDNPFYISDYESRGGRTAPGTPFPYAETYPDREGFGPEPDEHGNYPVARIQTDSGNRDSWVLYKRRKYNLEYWGGLESNVLLKTVQVYYDDNINKPEFTEYVPAAEAAPDGYYFAGWMNESTLTVPAVFDRMPENSKAVYAKWKPIKYRILLDFENGVPEDEELHYTYGIPSAYVLEYGDHIHWDKIDSASREGYFFDGWYLDEACTQHFDLTETKINSDIPGMDTNYRVRESGMTDDEYLQKLSGYDQASNTYYTDANDPDVRCKLVLHAKWVKRFSRVDGVEIHYLGNHDETEQTGYIGPSNEQIRDFTDGMIYGDRVSVITQDASTPDKDDTYAFRNWQLLNSDGTPSDITYYPGQTFRTNYDYAKLTEIWDNGKSPWAPVHSVHDFTGVSPAAELEPTCYKAGHAAGSLRCNICGHYYLQDESGRWELAEYPRYEGHGYEDEQGNRVSFLREETDPQNPKCNENVIVRQYCTMCGDESIYVNHPTEHTWQYEGFVDSTCTREGSYSARTCTVCGEHEGSGTIPKKPHTPVQGTRTKEPTCTEPGVYSYKCSVCGGSFTDPIPATGHGEATYETFKMFNWYNGLNWAEVQQMAKTQGVEAAISYLLEPSRVYATVDATASSWTVTKSINDQSFPDVNDLTCVGFFGCPVCGAAVYVQPQDTMDCTSRDATTTAGGEYVYTASYPAGWIAEEEAKTCTLTVTSPVLPGVPIHFISRGTEIRTLLGTDENNHTITLPSEAETLSGYTFVGWLNLSSYGPSTSQPSGMHSPGEANFNASAETSLYAVYSFVDGSSGVWLADTVEENDEIYLTSGFTENDYIFTSSGTTHSKVQMTNMVSGSGSSAALINIPNEAKLTLEKNAVNELVIRNGSGNYLYVNGMKWMGASNKLYCGVTFTSGNPKTIGSTTSTPKYLVWYGGQFTNSPQVGKNVYVWKMQDGTVTYYEVLSSAGGNAVPDEPAVRSESARRSLSAPLSLRVSSEPAAQSKAGKLAESTSVPSSAAASSETETETGIETRALTAANTGDPAEYTVTVHYDLWDYNAQGELVEARRDVLDPVVQKYHEGEQVNILSESFQGYWCTDDVVNFTMPAKDREGRVLYYPKYRTYQNEVWVEVPANESLVEGETYLIAASIKDVNYDFQSKISGDNRSVNINGQLALVMAQSEAELFADQLGFSGLVTNKWHQFTNGDTIRQAGWAALPQTYVFDSVYFPDEAKYIDNDGLSQLVAKNDDVNTGYPWVPMRYCQWTVHVTSEGKYQFWSKEDPTFGLYLRYGGVYPEKNKASNFVYDPSTYELRCDDYFASHGAQAWLYLSGSESRDAALEVRYSDSISDQDGEYRSEVHFFKRLPRTKENWRVYVMDDEGTWVDSVQVPNGGALRTYVEDPVKTNWTFQYWMDGTGAKIDDNTPVTDNIIVYPYFTPNFRESYAIYLRANYDPKQPEGTTHIYWYANNATGKNNGGGARVEDLELDVDEYVTIPRPYAKANGGLNAPGTEPGQQDADRIFWEHGTSAEEGEVGLSYEGMDFVGWAKVHVDGSGVGAPHPELTEDDVFLRWNPEGDNFILHEEGHQKNGQEVKKIAPYDMEADEDLYAVWVRRVEYFYIFHSATGVLERREITYTDSGLKAPVDLTEAVTPEHRYGGYYSSYGGVNTELLNNNKDNPTKLQTSELSSKKTPELVALIDALGCKDQKLTTTKAAQLLEDLGDSGSGLINDLIAMCDDDQKAELLGTLPKSTLIENIGTMDTATQKALIGEILSNDVPNWSEERKANFLANNYPDDLADYIVRSLQTNEINALVERLDNDSTKWDDEDDSRKSAVLGHFAQDVLGKLTDAEKNALITAFGGDPATMSDTEKDGFLAARVTDASMGEKLVEVLSPARVKTIIEAVVDPSGWNSEEATWFLGLFSAGELSDRLVELIPEAEVTAMITELADADLADMNELELVAMLNNFTSKELANGLHTQNVNDSAFSAAVHDLLDASVWRPDEQAEFLTNYSGSDVVTALLNRSESGDPILPAADLKLVFDAVGYPQGGFDAETILSETTTREAIKDALLELDTGKIRKLDTLTNDNVTGILDTADDESFSFEAYTGNRKTSGNVNFWTKANAANVKDLSAEEAAKINGETMIPTAGQIYYLKEVPEVYLSSKYYFTYKNGETGDLSTATIQGLYMVAVVDDNYYSKIGFNVDNLGSVDDYVFYKGALSTSFKIKSTATGSVTTSITVNAETFREGLNGYVSTVTWKESSMGREFNSLPTWTTLDGVEVHADENERYVNIDNPLDCLSKRMELDLDNAVIMEDDSSSASFKDSGLCVKVLLPLPNGEGANSDRWLDVNANNRIMIPDLGARCKQMQIVFYEADEAASFVGNHGDLSKAAAVTTVFSIDYTKNKVVNINAYGSAYTGDRSTPSYQ